MSIIDEAGTEESKTANTKEMITLYKAMIDEMRKVQKNPKLDKMRYRKLEMKVDSLWLQMTNPEQIQTVACLVKDDYMDERVAEMLVIFGGRIDMRKPAEPCLKI